MMFRAFSGVQLATWLALWSGVLAACSSTDDPPDPNAEPTCLSTPGPLDCTALYGTQSDGSIEPTFDQVYENTLSQRCATTSCHGASPPAGGMNLGTIDAAYESLLGDTPRIQAGDTECGKFIVRLETPDKPWSMPPGTPLSNTHLCSIRHWIANGAER